MIYSFSLGIDYDQILVFCDEHSIPNDWSEDHVKQGFVYRNGHVSFGVPNAFYLSYVEVEICQSACNFKSDSLAIIQVPFTVTGDSVTIASIDEEKSLPIENGAYQLTFQLHPGREIKNKSDIFEGAPERYDYDIFISFKKDNEPKFNIIKNESMPPEFVSKEIITKEGVPVSETFTKTRGNKDY